MQLFLGTLDIAFQAKTVTKESYQKLYAWYYQVYQQLLDDPIVTSKINRTYYGFIYETVQGTQKYFFNALPMTTVRQRQRVQQQGALASPIVKKTYGFEQQEQVSFVKQQYTTWLKSIQDESYFQMLKTIKALPGVISQAELEQVKTILSKWPYALAAVKYYESIWNLS